MREKTYRTALGGILAALASLFMLMGGVFPFAQFAGPCLASVAVMIFLTECGRKWAFFMYLAVSGVSVLVSPDLEGVLLFICFIGWYPILKVTVEKLGRNILVWLIKVLSLDICVGLMYYVLLRIVAVPALLNEFAEYTSFTLIVLILMANASFVLLDIALTRIGVAYLLRFRQKLVRS